MSYLLCLSPWRPGAPSGHAGPIIFPPALCSGLVHRCHTGVCATSPLLQVSGLGPECVLSGTHSQRETAGKKLERRGEIADPLRLKSGSGGHGGPLTVICLDKQGFSHSVSDTPRETNKGASDWRLPSPQEGGRARVAGCICFQMKLCAWGLDGLRPHSCISVCSACQALYLVSQPPGDRLGPYCSSRE